MLISTPVKYCWIGYTVVGILTAVGCGHKGPPRAPVTGTIHYQGKPVIGAAVTFVPVEARFRIASGVTDEQGNYRLETLGYGEGAILGRHKVCVALREPEPPRKGPALAPFAPKPIRKPLLPLKYFDPEKSGLTADVGDVPENRFDFDLKEST
jgi:hypothetical protein